MAVLCCLRPHLSNESNIPPPIHFPFCFCLFVCLFYFGSIPFLRLSISQRLTKPLNNFDWFILRHVQSSSETAAKKSGVAASARFYFIEAD